jgi:diaminohydroxyphosphoribosylaminopyrimidine deaminase/5-amino-6-(5-phosphoribosylamino)uracil reductase
MDDVSHMRAALGLARRGLGQCWPNPTVGCVIVREGRVVGRAVTAPGGRPHAEPLALAMAGAEARGATAYVTLEPCCHHGRTAPCTDALVAAGIARVVVAVRDCDPRVNGQGVARLRAAGIAVEEGLLGAEAEALNEGFFLRIRRNRPLVTLKLASTLDGRIATRSGESRWVTGEPARRAAHALRGRHDAVLVGVGTVVSDDPDLTCRIEGFRKTPLVRVVADSHLRTPLTSRLVATASAIPTWILARHGADRDRAYALGQAGASVISVETTGDGAQLGVDLPRALQALAARGITRVLAEGGAQLAAALLRADLVDRIAWFHAPAVLGADGWPAAQSFGVAALAAMPRFRRTGVIAVGEDTLTELARAA